MGGRPGRGKPGSGTKGRGRGHDSGRGRRAEELASIERHGSLQGLPSGRRRLCLVAPAGRSRPWLLRIISWAFRFRPAPLAVRGLGGTAVSPPSSSNGPGEQVIPLAKERTRAGLGSPGVDLVDDREVLVTFPHGDLVHASGCDAVKAAGGESVGDDPLDTVRTLTVENPLRCLAFVPPTGDRRPGWGGG